MELSRSFLLLLQDFRGVFSQPSFVTFSALVTGWCLSQRHRFVTELIQSSGSTHKGHHSRYHRFFIAGRHNRGDHARPRGISELRKMS